MVFPTNGPDELNAFRSIELHEHVAIIYQGTEEKLRVIAQLCRIGLERNERCVFITSDGEAIADRLMSTGIDVDAEVARGAILMYSGEEWGYLCSVSGDDAANRLENNVRTSIAEGFSGVRTFTSASFITDIMDSDQLCGHEYRLEKVLEKEPITGFCLFDMPNERPETIIDAIISHPVIILRGIVCRNFFYVPPGHQKQENGGSPEMFRLLDNLIQVHENEIQLQKSLEELRAANLVLKEEIRKRQMVEWALLISENRYKNTLDSIFMPVFVIDSEYHVILTNKAFDTVCLNAGYHSESYMGRNLFEAFPFLNENAKKEFEGIFRSGESRVVGGAQFVDGNRVNLEAKLIPTMEGDEVVSITTIARDFTLLPDDPVLRKRPKQI